MKPVYRKGRPRMFKTMPIDSQASRTPLRRKLSGAVLAGLVFSLSHADRPGDVDPLNGVHPGYTLTNLRPAGFEPQVSGMEFLPDGRLVLSTWGGDKSTIRQASREGQVLILTGVTGDPAKIKIGVYADSLMEPLGLKVLDDGIYVTERQSLVQLPDKNGDGKADGKTALITVPGGDARHEYLFGLLYRDGYFYASPSLGVSTGGGITVPQPHEGRGSILKIPKAGGGREIIADGFRQHNGMAFGPEGEMFVSDNQGGWVPTCKLIQVKPGTFHGVHITPAGKFDKGQTFTPPVAWLPYGTASNSSSQPLYVTSGAYKGQFLMGDVTYGGIQRVFVEKTGSAGYYQGCVFRFTQGLESGVNRLVMGPDGAFYVGGIGAPEGNWNHNGKTFGLQRLEPKSPARVVFEILAIRSKGPGSMEVEFTQPLASGSDAPSKYPVKQWAYIPEEGYGAGRQPSQTLSVKSAQVAADGKKVLLEITGLQAGKVVYFRLPGLRSQAGDSLWSTEAWYTLNAFGPGQDPPTALDSRAQASGGGLLQVKDLGTGNWEVRVPFAGAYTLGIWDMQGRRKAWIEKSGAREHDFSTSGFPSGIYMIEAKSSTATLSRMMLQP